MNDIVFDIETPKEFAEVGGKENMHKLGVSVVGIYDYATREFTAFERSELQQFEQKLEGARLIGFNSRHFDVPVLQPHVSTNLTGVPHLDLMEDIERALGFRVSLDNLTGATLGARKTGYGLDAVKWWREGEKEKVKKYCLQDVKLTRDLFEFGRKNGYVLCDTRGRGRTSVRVTWGTRARQKQSVGEVLRNAFQKRFSVEIEYITKTANTLGGTDGKRLVDICSIGENSFEAFCHLRGGRRIFYIDRVVDATVTDNSYVLENDVQRSLI